MNRKTLSKLISALLCLALLAGCAALAEEDLVATQVEATVPESVLAASLEDITVEPMAVEAPEPMAVEAPEPMAVEAPVAPMAAAEAVPMTVSPLVIGKKSSATMNVGEQLQLMPDMDGVLLTAWKSRKAGVASVDESGVVTALAKGKTKITATTADNQKYTLTLNVVDPYEPTSVSIAEGASGTVGIAQSLQLNAVLQPATAQSDLIWSSSKPKVATVDANGLVSPQSKGKTKITLKCAKNPKKKAVFNLTVINPNEPGAVGIAEGASGTAAVAQPVQLNAVLEPATAMSALTWKSSKPKVATVDANGLVTPLSEGQTKITVTTDNKKKATYTLTVADPYKPTGLTLAQGKAASLTAGQTLQLTPVLTPDTAKSALTWKSNKPGVATVDANGVVTAVGKGKAKITAQDGNYKKVKATIAITVTGGEAPPEPEPVPVDAKDLSAWLDKPAPTAESALGLKVEVETSSDGITYKLNGSGFYMNAKGADYASATITWIAVQGQGKSDFNICGFNTMGMTYDQALEKAKADKWTVVSNDDFGNFRGLVLKKGDKWLRVTDNSKRLVSAFAYAHAAS